MSVVTAEAQRPQISFVRVTPRLWQFGIFVLVAVLVATPLLFLVLGSFSTARLPSKFSFSELGLTNYTKVWTDPATYSVFANTLIYAISSTLAGICIAAVLAWLVERTDLPFKTWVYAGVPMTLVMPGMLQAMAWVLLASPRIGFINVGLMKLFDLSSPPFNVYSLGGMILIEGLRAVPTAFLMLVPLLRSMDPSLEEAAATSGAGPVSSIRKITLALTLPGLLAVMIYQFTTVLEGFEIPGVLGLPAGIYVFSTKIYTVLHSASGLPAYGEASSLGMLYVVIAILSTYLYSRVIRKAERYSILTGKGYRPKISALGRWRWPAFAFVVLYLSLSVIVPFLVFVYCSFLPYLQAPSAKAFASMSWTNYAAIIHAEQIGRVLWNTLVLMISVASAVVVLSFLISLVVVRSQFWGRNILDQICFIPHAIPGMVMGLALLWIFLQVDRLGVGLFGSIWSIAIAFTIAYISYGTRVMNAAILQIHKDLEDAAKMSGARPWRVMLRVFFPLLLPSIVGVWLWSILHVVRAAGMPLILTSGADNEVLAVVIWNMWDQGAVETVGAFGTLLILFMLALTFALRIVGLGRGAYIQRAN